MTQSKRPLRCVYALFYIFEDKTVAVKRKTNYGTETICTFPIKGCSRKMDAFSVNISTLSLT